VTRAGLAATTLAIAALGLVTAVRWHDGSLPAPRVLVADAAFPAAMAALPDGGVLYGERLTGRVIRVRTDGSTAAIGSVEVSTEGEQRGLVGLAVRGDEVFVSFTGADPRLRVSNVEGTTIWRGPYSADRANGGRIAFGPDGTLVIGVGDLLDPQAAADPSTPNGKMLALDPDGPGDQRPAVISSGWNNPFAFASDGTLYVADNAGGDGDERLAIGKPARGPSCSRPCRLTRCRAASRCSPTGGSRSAHSSRARSAATGSAPSPRRPTWCPWRRTARSG
jgi:hypothetical protein